MEPAIWTNTPKIWTSPSGHELVRADDLGSIFGGRGKGGYLNLKIDTMVTRRHVSDISPCGFSCRYV